MNRKRKEYFPFITFTKIGISTAQDLDQTGGMSWVQQQASARGGICSSLFSLS
jgi:hypothetical protein